MMAIRSGAAPRARLLAVAVVILIRAVPVSAQGVTTSAVTGVVTSESGQPAPGIQVGIRNTATGASSGGLTNADGRYYIAGLQPGGPYTISVQGIGFATQTEPDVTLRLSQTARFDFALETQAVAIAALEVTAERNAIISKGRTGTATIVSDSMIRRLPTISRDFTDFTRLTPQVSTSSGGTSGGGRNNRFNTVQIDGAVNNDLFGIPASGTPGGQAGTKPITLEAVQEFQVVLAPFDVRQGGFTGAGINAITRSGTNAFHGSLAYFGRSEALVGKYVGLAGSQSPDFGDFSEGSGAGAFGGPILRDRLHFFVAGELTRRSAPNSGLAIGRDNTYTSAEVQPIVDAVRTLYGYDAGDIGEITLDRTSDNVFARVDFNMNESHRLTLRHNYIKANDDNVFRGANSYLLGSSLYVFANVTNSSVAQLNSTFGGKFFNELRIGYATIRDERKVPNKFPFITVDLPAGPAGTRSISLGPENFSVANKLDQDVLELTNDLTFTAGRHNITLGTHNEIFSFSNLFARNIYGFYTFAGLAELNGGTPRRYEGTYLLPGGRDRPDFPVRQISAYLQDQLDVTDRFTVTAGVRLDYSQLPDSPGDNPVLRAAVPGRATNEVPSGKVLFNPRVGFNWDVDGSQSTQLRGGLGLFSGRTPYVWISNAYGNTGLDYQRFTCTTPALSPAFVADPDNQPRACRGATALVPNEINLVDPDFDFPQVFRTSVAVDRRLPWNLVGTLEGLYTKSVHDVLYRELTIDFSRPTTTVEGRPAYSRLTVPFSNITDVTNTEDNYSYSVTAQVQRNFIDRWSASLAYTYGRSFDVTSTTSSQAFSNWRFNPIRGNPNGPERTASNFDVPHRVVGIGSYRAQWLRGFATDLSLIYVGESGQRFSYTYNSTDVNNDGSNGNDLIYVPQTATEIRFQPASAANNNTTPEQSWANLDSYISSIDCLREARGTVIARNACQVPFQHRFDFRLAQAVPTLRGQSVEITLDILNAGNLINKEWGRSEFVSNQNDTPLRAASVTPDANGRVLFQAFAPRTTTFVLSDESSRYRIQLGGRYTF